MSHLIESHKSHRIGWLRAAVLGANDGILTMASLILGVASANGSLKEIIIASVSGLLAGALSMAAGEYVSVSSQADTENADLERERFELKNDIVAEEEELATIYIGRGLDAQLAMQVAKQLMAHDALSAHARDELGISEFMTARPLQAAFASGATFSVGALIPFFVALMTPTKYLNVVMMLTSLLLLCCLGYLSASAGGANRWRATLRILFWGFLAMTISSVIGDLIGKIV
jgi:VIT1/CCC1 family predicted Fe2+/Mn2+ transporter